MTAKREFNASISTKGLDKTGITEDIARKLYSRRGRKFMGIVELVVDETTDKRDSTHKVGIAIAGLEVLLDDSTFEEHVREIMRTLAYNRNLDEGQPTLPGDGINPKVDDVINAGVRHRPHPFTPVDVTEDNPICDICGVVLTSGPHTTEGFLPTEGDAPEPDTGDDEPTDTEDTDVDALTDEPSEDDVDATQEQDEPGEYDNHHAYDAGPDDVCQCGLPFEDDIHAMRQAGPEPTVAEVTYAQERARHLTSVGDPFTAPAGA